MNFATYTADDQQYYNAVTHGGMIAFSPDCPDWPTMRSVIEAGGLAKLGTMAQGRDVPHKAGAFHRDIPVPNPEKIICVSINFPDRNAEYKDGQEVPPNMSLFPRFPLSFVGHGTPLTRPARDAPA